MLERSAPLDLERKEPIVPWMLMTPERAAIPCRVVMSLKPIIHFGLELMDRSGSIFTRRIVP